MRDSDKRTDRRLNHRAPIRIAFINRRGNWTDAQMMNHGMGGICIKSRFPLTSGATVLIRVDGFAWDVICPVTDPEGLRTLTAGEVKWCKEIPDETFPAFEVGVKYFPPEY